MAGKGEEMGLERMMLQKGGEQVWGAGSVIPLSMQLWGAFSPEC